MKEQAHPGLVIEWSPQGVVAFDGNNVTTYATGATLPYAGREAIVSVSRRNVFVRSVRVPNAGLDEVRAVLSMRVADLFPIGISELAYDFQLTDDISSEGRLAIVIAMPSVELASLLAQMKASGIKVRQTIPAAFGSVLLALSQGRKDAVVVERTAIGTTVDVVINGHLHHSRAGGLAPIDVEVQRTLAMAGVSGVPILAAGRADYPSAEAHCATSSIEALGGVWTERIHVNLELPEKVIAREAASRARKVRMAALLAVASLTFATLAYMDFSDATSARSIQEAKYKGQLSRLEKIAAQSATSAASAVTLQSELRTAFQPAQFPNDVVTVATNKAPKDIWLGGVSVERGKPLLVRGTARTNDAVANYMKALGKEERLRDVKLVFATNAMIDTTPVVQFSISMFPVGNLPILEQQKQKKGAATK